MAAQKANLALTAVGGTVEVDGHDVTRGVQGLTLTAKAGHRPTLTLDMLVNEVELDGETTVTVPEQTAQALTALGWTAPGDLDALTNAYRERAQLVAHLASLYPAVFAYSDPNTPGWPVVTITTPAGQMSWHIAPADFNLFDHVPAAEPDDPRAQWDGHTTEQKYARLAALTAERGAQ